MNHFPLSHTSEDLLFFFLLVSYSQVCMNATTKHFTVCVARQMHVPVELYLQFQKGVELSPPPFYFNSLK